LPVGVDWVDRRSFETGDVTAMGSLG